MNPVARPVFAEGERLPVQSAVVLASQQPLRIDAPSVDQRGNQVEEKLDPEQRLCSEDVTQRRGWQVKLVRQELDAVASENRPKAVGDGRCLGIGSEGEEAQAVLQAERK
jgi:hypothetical protein